MNWLVQIDLHSYAIGKSTKFGVDVHYGVTLDFMRGAGKTVNWKGLLLAKIQDGRQYSMKLYILGSICHRK